MIRFFLERVPSHDPKWLFHPNRETDLNIRRGIRRYMRKKGRRPLPMVYALYKGSRLVYVGISQGNQGFGRVRAHKGDHLQGRWDRFSIYFLDSHDRKIVKVFEALLLHVLERREVREVMLLNRVRSRFRAEVNLRDCIAGVVMRMQRRT